MTSHLSLTLDNLKIIMLTDMYVACYTLLSLKCIHMADGMPKPSNVYNMLKALVFFVFCTWVRHSKGMMYSN